MPRKKYLNRVDQKDNAKDEWTHIPGVDGDKTRIEIADALDVQDRSIFIRGEEQEPLTISELIREEIKDAKHKTRNADQYVKYVNAILSDRLNRINRIKKAKQEFDDEIETLAPDHLKNFERLAKIPVYELNTQEITRLIKALSQERGITLTRLEHYKNKVSDMQNRLDEQDKKVAEVENVLQEKILKEKQESEKHSVDIIQEELKTLGEIYGMTKLSEAISLLKKSNGDKSSA